MKRFAVCLSSFALIVGCAATEDGDSTPTWETIVHEGECNQADYSVETGTAVFGRKQGKEFLGYSATGADGYDKLEFTSFLLADETEPLPAGSYVLDAEDGNDAEPMVRAYRDCDADGANCNEVYQATGVLVIDSSGVVGETFRARLNNVTFEEMDEDGAEPKRRGTTFCGSNVRWDSAIETNVMGDCSAEGEGSAVGDKLRDLVLKNCYGDTVSVHDNCGHVKAQVMVLTASWCSACRTRLPQTEQLITQYKSQGQPVEAYYILGNGNERGAPATLQECFSDAQAKSIDPARVLLDDGNGHAGFNETFRRGWADTCDSGLPNYIVLDGDDMSHNFASRCPDDPRAQTGYTAAIDELLDD